MALVGLDALERHSSMVLGPGSRPPIRIPRGEIGAPRAELERVLVDALQDPPCHVAFSGGRDSSVVLAAATDVARRHGLADPVPLTARYPAHPRTHENEWQEAVVRHLGLADWLLFDVTSELDALGAIATSALRRHGHYWPSNAHSMLLFARKAGQGTLLTGSGGDEVFSTWPGARRSFRTLAGVRPRRRALKQSALNALPGRVRHAIRTRRVHLHVPWVREPFNAELTARWRRGAIYHPDWGESVLGVLDSRYFEVVGTTLRAFAADEGVRMVEPLFDPRVVHAFAYAGPKNGYAGRGNAMEALFGDLLPRAVLYRSTKAVFNEISWGPGARGFAASWDGSGLDESLVDVARLREEWARPAPDARSVSALHLAWLHTQ